MARPQTVPVGRVLAACAVALMTLVAACGGGDEPPVFDAGAQPTDVHTPAVLWTEGPVADGAGALYFAELTPSQVYGTTANPGGRIWKRDPSSGQVTSFMAPSGMANGLHVDKRGDLIVAQAADTGLRRVIRVNLVSGSTAVLADSFEGKPLNSPNDVTSDASGRLYFTDSRFAGAESIEQPNAVYRIDTDGSLHRVAAMAHPNGIEVSPDGKRLYVAATNLGFPDVPDAFGISAGGVIVYDLDPQSGAASNGRLFYRNDALAIDGMAMDTAGNLYLAMGTPVGPAGEVAVLDPGGARIAGFTLPGGAIPTNLGFGRGADAGRLYITSAFEGKLFRIATNRVGHYF